MTSIIKPYNDALVNLFKNGEKTDSTLALYNQNIHFDLRPMNREDHNYSLFMPVQRGKMKSNVKYGLAEAVWYRHLTNDPSMIIPFGKIWDQMKDENGLVNSNYGYQLVTNNDVQQVIDDLVLAVNMRKSVTIPLYISSQENQFARHDLVCNNKIDVMLTVSDDTYYLSANVTARSIDMIFGMPYDMFAFQGLLAYLATMVNREFAYEKVLTLESLSFHIINMHWYLSQSPSQEDIDSLSDEVIIYEKVTETPFVMTSDEIRAISTTEEIKAYRDEQAEKYSSVRMITGRDLSIFNAFGPQILEFDKLEDVENVLKTHTVFTNSLDNAETYRRIDEVIEYLKANEFDRKTLVMYTNDTLAYVARSKGKWIVTFVKEL